MSRSGQEVKEDEDSKRSFKDKLLKIQIFSKKRQTSNLVHGVKENVQSNEITQKETEDIQPDQCESVFSLHSSDSCDEHMRTHRTRNDMPSRLSSIIRNGGIRMFPPSQERVPATYTAESPEGTENAEQTSSTFSMNKHEAETLRQALLLPPKAPKHSLLNSRLSFNSANKPTVDMPSEVIDDIHASDTVDLEQLTIGAETLRQAPLLPSKAPKPLPRNSRFSFNSANKPTVDMPSEVIDDMHAPDTVDLEQLTIRAETLRQAPLLPPKAPKPLPRNSRFSFNSANKPTVDMPSEVIDDIHASDTVDLEQLTTGAETLRQAPLLPPRAPKHSPLNSRLSFNIISIAQENDRLKEELLCKICLDKPVAIAFIPCGHAAACGECAKQLMRCAVCRANITGRLKIYI